MTMDVAVRAPKGGRQEVITEHLDAGARPVWGQHLTDPEYVFVCTYLETMQIGAAATACGYHASYGTNMIRKLHVRQAIDGALAERFNATKATIAGKMANIAFGSPKRFIKWGRANKKGVVRLSLTESRMLTDADWDMIVSVKSNPDGSIEVKLADRLAALEKLAKLVGVMRELPEADAGGGVIFIVGDPETALAKHRANRIVDVSGEVVQERSATGTHTDIEIAEPK